MCCGHILLQCTAFEAYGLPLHAEYGSSGFNFKGFRRSVVFLILLPGLSQGVGCCVYCGMGAGHSGVSHAACPDACCCCCVSVRAVQGVSFMSLVCQNSTPWEKDLCVTNGCTCHWPDLLSTSCMPYDSETQQYRIQNQLRSKHNCCFERRLQW